MQAQEFLHKAQITPRQSKTASACKQVVLFTDRAGRMPPGSLFFCSDKSLPFFHLFHSKVKSPKKSKRGMNRFSKSTSVRSGVARSCLTFVSGKFWKLLDFFPVSSVRSRAGISSHVEHLTELLFVFVVFKNSSHWRIKCI